MALKFGTSSVNDVKYKVNSTDKVVTVIQNASGVVYWARPGTLSIDSITGVSSTTVSRSATIEPSAATGALGNGATIYHGDTLKMYPTAATYWKVSSPVTATMNFLATQSFAAASVINPTRKLRNIIISNPDQACNLNITYTNSSGTRVDNFVCPTQYLTTSGTISNTWSGGSISYAVNTGKTTDPIWYMNSLSGTIAAENNENDVVIDLSLKTFNLRTYTNGNITYYTTPAMTTAITQSKYSTHLYYKYTPNNGCYVWNGSSYTTYLSGTVPTNSSYISGITWGPFTSEQENYSKLNINVIHRGATYFKLSTDTDYTKIGNNTPGSNTITTYVVSGSTINVYTNYAFIHTYSIGLSASTYATADDSYISADTARTLTLTSGNTTITFSGALRARTITINQEKAAHGTGVTMQYYSTDYQLTTLTDVDLNQLTPTDVWRGATITLSSSGTLVPSTGWTTSGYDQSYRPSTTAINHNVVASYNYTTASISTNPTTSGRGTFITLSVASFTTAPSAYVSGYHGSVDLSVVLPSNQDEATYTDSNVTITALRGDEAITGSILGTRASTTRSISIVAATPVIAPPALRWSSGKNHIYIYNPNSITLTLAATARQVNGVTVTLTSGASVSGYTTYSYTTSMPAQAATGTLTSQITNSWSNTSTL